MAHEGEHAPRSMRALVRAEIARVLADMEVEAPGGIMLEQPNDSSHGDLSCNVALTLARPLRRNPREVAAEIVGGLRFDSSLVDRVEIAGPGFINLSWSPEFLRREIVRINRLGAAYGDSDAGSGRRIQVEYISANPTGPLVIVSARAAAVGSALVNILRKAGWEVEAEYYVNDAGAQVEKLGRSVLARFRERLGETVDFPEDGYPGSYLVDIAAGIPLDEGRAWLGLDEAEAAGRFGGVALDRLVERIKEDLERFGVRFDVFYRESRLHEAGALDSALAIYRENGSAYEEDGAVWFRSSVHGDEKDRVLVRSDGTPTYFLADAAYHRDKFDRGFDRVIDILGPDHHGYIARLAAAALEFGAPPGWLDVMIVQWVRLLEDGKQVSMSKRAGEFVTLRDLVEDVGVDAAKFFFLMRKTNAHLDFNLTLAREQSEENPVYYVQYAHARISSVIAYAREQGVDIPEDESCVSKLGEPEEIDLMRRVVTFPQIVEGAAEAGEPHRLTGYARDLAAGFHRFYHVCRIVSGDAERSEARLLLAEATRIVLAESLRLLGVSAPEKM